MYSNHNLYSPKLQSPRWNAEILCVSYLCNFIRPCFIYYILFLVRLHKYAEVKKQSINACKWTITIFERKITFLHIFGIFYMISNSKVHGPHNLQNTFFSKTQTKLYTNSWICWSEPCVNVFKLKFILTDPKSSI